MSDIRNCPTCDSPAPNLHPAVQSEGEVQPCKDPWHTPPPDAQAMTRDKRVLTSEEYVKALIGLAGSPLDAECDPDCFILAEHFRGQAETIRRLEQQAIFVAQEKETLLQQFCNLQVLYGEQKHTIRDCQARLTASEAKHRWTTARPTVKGQYWWRGSTDDKYPEVIPVFLVQGKSELHAQWGSYIALAEGGEWQGPLTPGEE